MPEQFAIHLTADDARELFEGQRMLADDLYRKAAVSDDISARGYRDRADAAKARGRRVLETARMQFGWQRQRGSCPKQYACSE